MTREEAIKKLQKQKAEYLDEWVDFSGISEAYDMAIEALKAQENMIPLDGEDIMFVTAKEYKAHEWIPCSERMPEEGQEVFLQYQHKVIERDFFAVTCRSDYNYWHDIGRDIFAIAWKPLPEPYKAESEDKE